MLAINYKPNSDNVDVTVLKGKTLTKAELVDFERFLFVDQNGNRYSLNGKDQSGDRLKRQHLHGVDGDLNDLIDSEILVSEESIEIFQSSSVMTEGCAIQLTITKLATAKGHVKIEWRDTSYYQNYRDGNHSLTCTINSKIIDGAPDFFVSALRRQIESICNESSYLRCFINTELKPLAKNFEVSSRNLKPSKRKMVYAEFEEYATKIFESGKWICEGLKFVSGGGFNSIADDLNVEMTSMLEYDGIVYSLICKVSISGNVSFVETYNYHQLIAAIDARTNSYFVNSGFYDNGVNYIKNFILDKVKVKLEMHDNTINSLSEARAATLKAAAAVAALESCVSERQTRSL